MTAVIVENKPNDFVSIRHLGVIEKGVEDTTSEKVRADTYPRALALLKELCER